MIPRESGFLLLSGKLGDPDRKPLTTAQLRQLAQRASLLLPPDETAQLTVSHLMSIGMDQKLSEHILNLMEARGYKGNDKELLRRKRMCALPVEYSAAEQAEIDAFLEMFEEGEHANQHED